MTAFVSQSCEGEICTICGSDAEHKVSEYVQWDDPIPDRHGLTAYICHRHFVMLMGTLAMDERDSK